MLGLAALIATGCVLVFASFGGATTLTTYNCWLGVTQTSGNYLWATGSNWSRGHEPIDSEIAYFGNGSTAPFDGTVATWRTNCGLSGSETPGTNNPSILVSNGLTRTYGSNATCKTTTYTNCQPGAIDFEAGSPSTLTINPTPTAGFIQVGSTTATAPDAVTVNANVHITVTQGSTSTGLITPVGVTNGNMTFNNGTLDDTGATVGSMTVTGNLTVNGATLKWDKGISVAGNLLVKKNGSTNPDFEEKGSSAISGNFTWDGNGTFSNTAAFNMTGSNVTFDPDGATMKFVQFTGTNVTWGTSPDGTGTVTYAGGEGDVNATGAAGNPISLSTTSGGVTLGVDTHVIGGSISWGGTGGVGGRLITNGHNLTADYGATATASQTAGWVDTSGGGLLIVPTATGTNIGATSFTFPVGGSANYLPFGATYTSKTGSGNIGVGVLKQADAHSGSTVDTSSNYIKRVYEWQSSGTTVFNTFSPTFTYFADASTGDVYTSGSHAQYTTGWSNVKVGYYDNNSSSWLSSTYTGVDTATGTYPTISISGSIGDTQVVGGGAQPPNGEFAIGAVASTLTSFSITDASGNAIADQTAGAWFGIKITAKDQNGNTYTGFNGTVTLSAVGSTCTQACGTTGTFTNGVLTLNSSGTGPILTTKATGVTLHVTDGTHTGDSNTFNVNAATPSTYVVSGANSSTAGQNSASVTLTLKDAFNNTATATADTTITPSSNSTGSNKSFKPNSATTGSNDGTPT
ncbi:MAG TPA: hypothetical protein VHD91_04060, partial [Gaiellaceae bacterium]|nr:hypothetical protein [Gaiellaceae bacterium]